MIKYIWKSNKNKGRPGSRLNAVGKAGRENNQSRHKSHRGVKQSHADGLPGQPPLLADVAPENGQSADSNAQGKEGLAQGCEESLPKSGLHHFAEIRL